VSTDTKKTALIIGATRGIGAATARRFLAEGYTVAGTHRGNGSVPDGVHPVELDITEEASIAAGFKAALEYLGSLDTLVVASGITKDGLLMRASEADILDVLRTNTVGPILAAKAALKPMLRQKNGSIILMSSMSVKYGVAGQTTYTASKGAIEAFVRSMAREYSGRGIRVTAVAPGTTDTDMVAAMTDDERAQMMTEVPMNRLAQPEEIADAIFHVAENPYMSGSTVQVSGGA
jgi:3-oxoacyl-[acyl-carrier protein] reductase